MKKNIRLKNFRDLNVGTRLSIIFFVLISLVFALFVWGAGRCASNLLETRAQEELNAKTQSVINLIEIFNADLKREANRSVRIFSSNFPGKFVLEKSATVKVEGVMTPALKSGEKIVNNDHSFADRFSSRSGVPATVFVRKGDDFVRVSTSLKKSNGARAVGTALSHNHPGYSLLLAGKPYGGVAALFGRKYFTHYEPVFGDGGEVIAALFIGIDYTDEVKAIEKRIAALKIGETGSFYAISSKKGDEYGRLVLDATIAGQVYKAGSNLVDFKSADGVTVTKDMLMKKNGSMQYLATSPSGKVRERTIAFAAFPEWDWLIVGGTYTDEITKDVFLMRIIFAASAFVSVLLLCAVLYIVIRRNVRTPLASATDWAQRIAGGDLSVREEVTRRDEIGQLQKAIESITLGLANVIWSVKNGTDMIANAAQEIASGNQDLSSRTEEQASSLEETASSMEELTSTVRQNADNARQANQLTLSATEIATKGGDVVGEVVRTMHDIHESSRRIADIINVIDGIAFQTNILALNAAVEAARAGEQGRGFAVVATEVRNLAQRSATAAQEIKDLIVDSVGKVEVGNRLVGQAGDTMQEILESVRRVSDIMTEIAEASREQTDGIEQVNQAITQMDQVTQQNAALVEESAAAAESMRNQTVELLKQVELFKLRTTEMGTADEAVVLVKKAVQSIQALGKEETFSDINNPFGGYTDRDLYVVVYDTSGRNLAHGANPKLIGQSLIEAKDGAGKLYVKERIEIVQAHGSGWQDYMFLNPISKQMEPKSMYLEKLGELIVGCGIYKN